MKFEYHQDYDSLTYGKGISSLFLIKSHVWQEKFEANNYYGKVLEIGCGTGQHFKFVKHKFDKYIMTDVDERLVNICRQKYNSNSKLDFRVENALNISYCDNSFDRIIASHVLEHLPDPELAISEWYRTLKSKGKLSILLPCDPGIAWRLGRYLFVRNKYKSKFDYDYFMAKEHINSIFNLLSLIRYNFKNYEECWYPLRVSSPDINLFYNINIYKP
jgi:phosphatidylethanolamine/phosphatidyl-N-methylethanolamine N-methyltransferase